MIPKGWKNCKLDRLVKKIGSGITPKGGREVYIDRGIPLIRSQNVLWGKLSLKDVAYISLEQHNKMKSTHLETNDVLLNITGASIGRSCVFPEIDTSANVNQHVCIIRTSEKLDPVFLNGYLNSQLGQNQILSLQAGGNRQGLNFEQIRNFNILLPPLLEQCRIAEVLGVWDESIDLLERLIGRVRSRKQGLMQQLLTGKKRFKEFEGSEWGKLKISKLMVESRIRGSTGLDARKITVKLYCKGVFAKDEKRVGSENTNYFKRKSGQFIYSKLDFLNGAFGIVPNELDNYESTLDLPCFDFTEYAIPKFVFYFVGREEFYSRFQEQAIGGRKARRVSPEEFLGTEIKIPSLPEQEKIAGVLSAADEEISTLEKQLAAYKQQKLGLMQQLLTGKIRVE